MSEHDTAAPEHVKESDDGFANNGEASLAVVASPGDDEDFVGLFDLLLAKPGLSARHCGVDGWKRGAQVERASGAESCLVERLSKTVQSNAPLRFRHATQSTSGARTGSVYAADESGALCHTAARRCGRPMATVGNAGAVTTGLSAGASSDAANMRFRA